MLSLLELLLVHRLELRNVRALCLAVCGTRQSDSRTHTLEVEQHAAAVVDEVPPF